MKTILVPVEEHRCLDAMLVAAWGLAQKYGGYMECMPIEVETPRVVSEEMGGFIAAGLDLEKLNRHVSRKKVEELMRQRGILAASQSKGKPYFTWAVGGITTDRVLSEHARVFDITVLGQPEAGGPRMQTLQAVLFYSGRPILMIPPQLSDQVGERILIAWTGSTEAARTVALAQPLLREASYVAVLTVEGTTLQGPSGDALVRSFRLAGIAAHAFTVSAERRFAGEAILRTTASLRCDLLVKGAYTKGKVHQAIFGGPTRYLIENAPVPLFMAH